MLDALLSFNRKKPIFSASFDIFFLGGGAFKPFREIGGKEVEKENVGERH
jgi:hypothetical protein